MTEGTMIVVVFIVFFSLLLSRIPVAFALGLASFAYFLTTSGPPMSVVQKTAIQMSDEILVSIPFFILCGEIMAAGGMARRLIDLANVLVGFIRGGLAMVNVLASMFFGGISGSSVADTSSIGSILIPMMVRKGYDRDFSVAVTVTSSTQGIIIPPSHNAIIYSLAAGGSASVHALFLAGYLPGLTVGVALMAVSWWIARARGYPREVGVPLREAKSILIGSLPALVTPLIIMVPISMGRVPAHRPAVLAVLWAAGVSTFIYRSLPWRRYPRILLRASKTSGMVLILVGCAAAFGEVLTYLHVPARMASSLLSATDSRVVMLLSVNLLLLALGLIMDMAPLIVITTPVLLPAMIEVGVDPVQFGIILLLNLGLGLCTPPVGSTLFVGCAIGKISIEKVTMALWPFYLVMLAVLLLVTFVPAFSLWLPSIMAQGIW